MLPDSALLGYSAHTGHVLPEGLLKARPGIHAQLSLETIANLRRLQRRAVMVRHSWSPGANPNLNPTLAPVTQTLRTVAYSSWSSGAASSAAAAHALRDAPQ